MSWLHNALSLFAIILYEYFIHNILPHISRTQQKNRIHSKQRIFITRKERVFFHVTPFQLQNEKNIQIYENI